MLEAWFDTASRNDLKMARACAYSRRCLLLRSDTSQALDELEFTVA